MTDLKVFGHALCGCENIRPGKSGAGEHAPLGPPRPRAGHFVCAAGEEPGDNKKTLIEALEKELAELRDEKAVLSQREAAILKTLSAYTGGEAPVIRATREMNTVDMAPTVIRNAAVQ
jgi:hypothetical protein